MRSKRVGCGRGIAALRGGWRGRTRWLARCGALFTLSACAVEPEIQSAPFVLQQLDSCLLGHASSVEVRALGDFPSRAKQLAELTPSTFDDFPTSTRELSVRVSLSDGMALGRRLIVPAAVTQPLLLLPSRTVSWGTSGLSCPLSDRAARAIEGAMVAALPSGGFLMAGGRDEDGLVASDALTFTPGAALVEQVPNGMLLRRAYASATPVGQFILIAGGARDLRGSAHETYEVFDAERGSFEGSRTGKLAAGPRMEHGAALLPDSRVLLAGGRAEPDGLPLSTAELIDLSRGVSEVIKGSASMRDARLLPVLLTLDSGSVLVLGGRSGRDASSSIVASVERFELDTHRFSPLELTLPVRREAVAVALPGARVAWLACDSGPAAVCELGLLLEDQGEFTLEMLALDFAREAPLGLSDLSLLSLDAGQLLLTAADPGDATVRRRAFLLDLNAAEIRRLDASRVPSALLSLRTGQIAELDAAGASLREQSSLSEYDSPFGNLVEPEQTLLALDAPAHWDRSDEGLRALVTRARFDLPRLRFVALRVELDSEGDASLLFLTDQAGGVTVDLVGGEVQAPGCRRRLATGAHLVAVRDGSQLALQSSTGDALCRVALSGAVHVAVRAQQDTLIRAFSVQRR